MISKIGNELLCHYKALQSYTTMLLTIYKDKLGHINARKEIHIVINIIELHLLNYFPQIIIQLNIKKKY